MSESHDIEQIARVKPLVWVPFLDDGSIQAHTPFGSYTISVPDPEIDEDGFRWKYCFDEYYDEDEAPCESIEDGKAKAQANWSERIADIFEPVSVAPLIASAREEGARDMRGIVVAEVRGIAAPLKGLDDSQALVLNQIADVIGWMTLPTIKEG